MMIEALPPDGGVARASVNGIEHIRLRDIAKEVAGLWPDPRWPSVGFADTAARMFIDETGIPGVMIHTLEKRGRYVPRDQLQPAIDFLTSSATIAEAQERTWKSINANRSKRSKAMTPITFELVAENIDRPKVYKMMAPNFRSPIHFSLSSAGIFFSVSDIVCELTERGRRGASGNVSRFCATLPAEDYIGLVAHQRTSGGMGGRAMKFMHERHRQRLCEHLALRADYDKARATHLERRIAELSVIVGPIVTSLVLAELTTAQAHAVRAEPSARSIVAETIGAGAETLPAIIVDAKQIAETVPGSYPPAAEGAPFDHLRGVPPFVADDPAKLEELKKVEAEPNPRQTTAQEIVRRMGLVERNQEALIERLDRMLAEPDAHAPLLEEIRAGVQQQTKAVASMRHQADERLDLHESALTRAVQIVETQQRQIDHLRAINESQAGQLRQHQEEIAYRDRQYERLTEVVHRIGQYCAGLIAVAENTRQIGPR